jgi:hypothetical protein
MKSTVSSGVTKCTGVGFALYDVYPELYPPVLLVAENNFPSCECMAREMRGRGGGRTVKQTEEGREGCGREAGREGEIKRVRDV